MAENGFVGGSLRNADSIIDGGESDYGQAKKYGRNGIYGRGEATLLEAQSFLSEGDSSKANNSSKSIINFSASQMLS